MCYEDEGVYVNTYGRITKDVVLQWGEMPTSVGTSGPETPRLSGASGLESFPPRDAKRSPLLFG